ncbi:MAG: GH25 family lysozyme, partial [Eubacterium sp.]
MKSKFKIILSFVLALMLAVQAPLVALATTKSSSPFISGTYTHQTKFDKFKRYDGVDVSSYQEDINWKKAKADGVDFAMIRVGCRGYANSGTFIDDKYFVQNITNAKKAGVKVGAYFYSQAISVADAKKEANHVLNLISKYEFDLPIAYDIEYAEKNGSFVGRLY